MANRKEYFKVYNKLNKDYINKRNRDYYKSNRDKRRAWWKKFYHDNRVEINKRRKVYMDNYREINKEELRLKRLEYAKLHAKERSLYNKEYHELNKVVINKRHTDYFRTPVGKLSKKASKSNRRCLEGNLTKKVVQQVYEENIVKFGTLTCELCIKPCEFGQDALEHFHPVSRRAEYDGDINERKNLGVAHRICNSKKGTQTLEEFIGVGERNVAYDNVS